VDGGPGGWHPCAATCMSVDAASASKAVRLTGFKASRLLGFYIFRGTWTAGEKALNHRLLRLAALPASYLILRNYFQLPPNPRTRPTSFPSSILLHSNLFFNYSDNTLCHSSYRHRAQSRVRVRGLSIFPTFGYQYSVYGDTTVLETSYTRYNPYGHRL
jgi:hypothetical protein